MPDVTTDHPKGPWAKAGYRQQWFSRSACRGCQHSKVKLGRGNRSRLYCSILNLTVQKGAICRLYEEARR
jgi:hypothetical protein